MKTYKLFYRLKRVFVKAVLLHHFNSACRTRLETDASEFAISSILSQLVKNKNWVSVIFYSQKIHLAELNYEIHDQELLMIMKSFCY